MVKLGVSDRRPEDDFRPVGKVSPMVKRRDWVMIVHMLQLFLCCQCLLNQVSMETTQPEDKYAEDESDEGSYDAEPVRLQGLAKDLGPA